MRASARQLGNAVTRPMPVLAPVMRRPGRPETKCWCYSVEMGACGQRFGYCMFAPESACPRHTAPSSPSARWSQPDRPYPPPGEECVAYNKISWPLNTDRMVLLVHDMQNYWVDLFAEPGPLLANVAAL